MPQPPSSFLQIGVDNLVADELSYNISEMEQEFTKLFKHCNAEQLNVYNIVLNSVKNNSGGLYFVYGSGGCGKTYIWKTLIYKLRSLGKIVLPVASSGIAATLMPGGRTAHSRFKIPIILDEDSSCGISHKSDIAELIKYTSLIIWDEAPMQRRHVFECLDHSLCDIMKVVNPERAQIPFGEITVLLGGDFRQILPVITLGSRGDIVAACITRSRLWSFAKIFILKQNMRLKQGKDEGECEVLRIFAEWVLQIGDGKVCNVGNELQDYHEDDIVIPAHFCNPETTNTVENMIEWTYPDFESNYQFIVDKIPGDSYTHFSVDKAEDFGGTATDLNFAFPPEYLNSINIPGLPPHELKLKVGVAVMLMRNLHQTLELCTGTRMIVTKCLKYCVQCEVICGAFVGTRHFIIRMELFPTETELPFKLLQKQMPLQICYSMTINKAQGQSLKRVGLFLPKSVFTHGQMQWTDSVYSATCEPGLNVIVVDEHHECIHIWIKPMLLYRFSNFLLDGKMYEIKNFVVTPYNNNYKCFASDFHIYFTEDTLDIYTGLVQLSDTVSTMIYVNHDTPPVHQSRQRYLGNED
ncbi:uncharacterized protein LOC141665765 [Apium graveolens]|uniref:uncharacterized protein LOC141665765 n=1 Tax=Apium graveolens TaxID=4045 RepID=UPI003D79D19C